MKIAIVTPYYEGENYIKNYCRVLNQNKSHLKETDDIFAVVINDSPWSNPSFEDAKVEIKLITNKKNLGIHESRIIGFNYAKESKADFVLFLDQDDELSEDAICEFIRAAKNESADIYISNAKLCQKNWESLWYRTKKHKNLIWDIETYITVGTQIISPGQCMIKIDSIPDEWQNYILRDNGADDVMLWLLMMGQKKKAYYIDKALYTHNYTGKNLSSDTKTTDKSMVSFIPYLSDIKALNKNQIKTLKRMISYKDDFRSKNALGKMLCSAKNPDIFAKNAIYKIKTKTGYGFNR